MSEATWRAWFSSIRPVAVTNGILVLSVPSGVVRDRLEVSFAASCATPSSTAQAKRSLSVSTCRLTTPLRKTSRDNQRARSLDAQDRVSVQAVQHDGGRTVPARPKDGSSADDVPLNPKYTFDAFVTGPSNRFAHAGPPFL